MNHQNSPLLDISICQSHVTELTAADRKKNSYQTWGLHSVFACRANKLHQVAHPIKHLWTDMPPRHCSSVEHICDVLFMWLCSIAAASSITKPTYICRWCSFIHACSGITLKYVFANRISNAPILFCFYLCRIAVRSPHSVKAPSVACGCSFHLGCLCTVEHIDFFMQHRKYKTYKKKKMRDLPCRILCGFKTQSRTASRWVCVIVSYLFLYHIYDGFRLSCLVHAADAPHHNTMAPHNKIQS